MLVPRPIPLNKPSNRLVDDAVDLLVVVLRKLLRSHAGTEGLEGVEEDEALFEVSIAGVGKER
jgi:hypothetical protein